MQERFSELYGADPMISTVSPVIGQELAQNAMFALALAAVGVILYASIRFEWRMGLPAVLALLHDAFIMLSPFLRDTSMDFEGSSATSPTMRESSNPFE